MVTRRQFCLAGAVGVLATTVRTAAGQEEVTATGRLSSEADTSVDGTVIQFSNVETGEQIEYTVGADGGIELSLTVGTYRVTTIDESGERNQIPAIYSFDNIEITTDGDIRELVLPEGYRTLIQCVDTEGNPIESLPVNFRAANGTGLPPGRFTTDADGYVTYFDAAGRGVELAGETEIEVQSPADPNQVQSLRTITVTDATEIEVTVSNPQQYTYNFELISADSEAGFRFPYFLYTPPAETVQNSGDQVLDSIETRPLVVGVVLRAGTEPRDQQIADGRAEIQSGRGRAIADELNTPAVVALLPSSPPDGSFELLDQNSLRNAEPPYDRLDQQLLAMIDDARSRLNDEPYTVADTVQLYGFSNSGRFNDQFTILHPDRVNAVSSGGNGFATIPQAQLDEAIPVRTDPDTTTLPWPVGTADLAELTGTAFKKQAWLDIDQYRYIGGEDQGNPDKSDLDNEYIHAKSYNAWGDRRQQLLVDVFGWEQVDERFATSRDIFENVGAAAEFSVYDGVGHETPPSVTNDILAFHRQQMIDEFESVVARYSGDDGEVTANDLGDAVTAFGEGDLTASELGEVVTAFGQS
ncbi:hypothetical protein ACFQMF_15535 [Halorubrum rutilum]|uniref:Uncharacterized protein n=1 Tax=Halorubrum rutilum TaxID=1364933 RepID=A0ABD6APL7_9EURY|nr:hypothetical protein [Halorubrum rutilum]